MKNLRKYSLLMLLFVGIGFSSCEQDSSDLNSDELTGGAETGGLITFESVSIGYVVGNGVNTKYNNILNINQSDKEGKTTSVAIYKTFTAKNSAGVEVVSNKILLRTVTFPAINEKETLSLDVTYNELIAGLIIDGSPISTNDADLEIGDFWTLSFVSTVDNGTIHEVATKVKISVGTRFAGAYKAVDAVYYRIGVLNATTSSWPDETIIESVDATTYRVVEYFGIFAANTFYFQIDANDRITYPATTPEGAAQVGNGQPFITCETNPADMSLVNCATSNKVVRDDVNGKDQLYMSFGYFTPGSGPRTFYQVLQKI